MTALIVVCAILAVWFGCGHVGGRAWARRMYATEMTSLYSSERSAESDARFGYGTGLLCGPLSLIALVFVRHVEHAAPAAVPAYAAAQQSRRIAELEAEIDRLHREVGVKPLRRAP